MRNFTADRSQTRRISPPQITRSLPPSIGICAPVVRENVLPHSSATSVEHGVRVQHVNANAVPAPFQRGHAGKLRQRRLRRRDRPAGAYRPSGQRPDARLSENDPRALTLQRARWTK